MRRMVLLCLLSSFFLALPSLLIGAPQDQDGSELAQLITEYHLKQNVVKPPSGILKHEYLVPAGPYFQLFDWDMYFMGVALSYDGVGKPVAESVKDFLEFVNSNADWQGYTPREIAPDGFWALPEMCKPFLAQAALRASLTMGDYEWLRPYFAELTDTLAYWENVRQSPDGLFRWFNGVESGVDNNPAVSDKPAVITEGVDLQCYIFREYEALAILADKLGNSEQAAKYRQKAADLQFRVQQKMWSEQDGMFLNIDSRTGKFVPIKTWTNFVPLWAGIATPQQAQRMIKDHLLNPQEFWAPHGIRSLAADEPLYNPESGYWRGPVWVISNYLLMHGLMNYGYYQQARELAEKTVALVVQDLTTSGGMNENYNPQTGAPTGAGHFVSWDLLTEHMLEEAVKGTDPTAIGTK